MNDAQRALLERLRELVIETPRSGALNAGKQPYHPTRFAQAVERRADDGDALVKYVRAKVHEPATDGYDALIEAGRPDLTVEALVADANAPWTSEFDEDDRRAANERLENMLEANQVRRDAAEAEAVESDRRILTLMNKQRADQGKGPLSPAQEAQVMERLASQRAAKR